MLREVDLKKRRVFYLFNLFHSLFWPGDGWYPGAKSTGCYLCMTLAATLWTVAVQLPAEHEHLTPPPPLSPPLSHRVKDPSPRRQ